MIKINLNCQNAVEQAAFPLYISIDLIIKSISAIFLLVYTPISVKSDPPFGGGVPAGTDTMHTCTGFGGVAEGMERIQHLTLLLSGPSRMENNTSVEQETSSVPEDLKTLIATSGWTLGGLVVIGIFCLVFIALILFAAIFGCCSSPRHKRGGS